MSPKQAAARAAKTIAALSCALALVFGGFPVVQAPVAAQAPEENKAFQVGEVSFDTWEALATHLNALSDSNSAVEVTMNKDVEVSAITMVKRFRGTFDGKGHKITLSGVTMNCKSSEPFGLFQEIAQGGTVKNLVLVVDGVTITGSGQDRASGGVLAGLNQGRIERCAVLGNGFDLGYGSNRDLTLNDFWKGGKKPQMEFGPIAGKNTGTINESCSQGTIYFNGTNFSSLRLGGIVGFSPSGTITNCSVLEVLCYFQVTDGVRCDARSYVGGIVGYAKEGGSQATINSCYAGNLRVRGGTSSNIQTGMTSGDGGSIQNSGCKRVWDSERGVNIQSFVDFTPDSGRNVWVRARGTWSDYTLRWLVYPFDMPDVYPYSEKTPTVELTENGGEIQLEIDPSKPALSRKWRYRVESRTKGTQGTPTGVTIGQSTGSGYPFKVTPPDPREDGTKLGYRFVSETGRAENENFTTISASDFSFTATDLPERTTHIAVRTLGYGQYKDSPVVYYKIEYPENGVTSSELKAEDSSTAGRQEGETSTKVLTGSPEENTFSVADIAYVRVTLLGADSSVYAPDTGGWKDESYNDYYMFYDDETDNRLISASYQADGVLLPPVLAGISGGTLTIEKPKEHASVESYQIYYRIGSSGSYALYEGPVQVSAQTGKITVTAYAVYGSRQSSTVSATYDPSEAFPVPAAPRLRIGNLAFDVNRRYDSGSTLTLSAESGTEIYYKFESVSSDFWIYSDEEKLTLWEDYAVNGTVTLVAYAQSTSSGNRSSEATFPIRLNSAFTMPESFPRNGGLVASGTQVTLRLGSADEVLQSSTVITECVFVDADEEKLLGLDQNLDLYNTNNENIREELVNFAKEHREATGETYQILNIVANTNTFSALRLPRLYYSTKPGDTVGKQYTYAMRIQMTDYVYYYLPTKIPIKGAPGDSVAISAWVKPAPGDTAHRQSGTQEFEFTVRDKMGEISAEPASGSNVTINDSIALSYEGVEAFAIRYTTDGTPPTIGSSLYTAPLPVKDIEVGGYVRVRAIAVSTNEGDPRDPSEIYDFRYRLANLPFAPQPEPLTKSGSSVRLGEPLYFDTDLLQGELYYTVGMGSVPTFGTDGEPVEDSGTLLYNPATGILMGGDEKGSQMAGSTYAITIIARDKSDPQQYLDSKPLRVVYYREILPAAPQPRPATAPGSSVRVGEPLYFDTDLLRGELYYTLGTSGVPSPDDASGATKLYNAATGIPMGGDAAGEQMTGDSFIVTIMAHDASDPQEYADSRPLRAVYTKERAAAPTASPSTSDSSVTTVAPGDIIYLSSISPDAKIFYSTDNSTPTIPYDDKAGITVPADVRSFFTIRAYASAEGYADSSIVRLVYQLPEPVQAVLASPSGKVTKGTQVTLATTTEKAVIYYELYEDGDDYLEDDDELSKTPPSDLTRDEAAGKVPTRTYSEPITMDKSTWIRAVALKDGVYSAYTVTGIGVMRQLDPPETSLPSGSVVGKGATVTLTAERDASLAYTVDGSDPKSVLKSKTSSSSSSSSSSGSGNIIINTTPVEEKSETVLYGDQVVIDGDYGETVTVRAFAYATDYTPSEIASFTYTIVGEEEKGGVTASPASGTTVSPGDAITLTSSLTGAGVYYTTDGETPGEGSDSGTSVAVEGEPGGTFVLKAVAIAEGAGGGTPVTFTYPIRGRSKPPTASIPSGAITLSGAAVALTAAEGAAIYYTTDGSDPTASSAPYSAPIALTESIVLKAIAVETDLLESEAAVFTYTRAGQVAAPVFSRPSGDLTVGTRVDLTSETAGALIYYSTDGTEPTAGNLEDLTLYDSPIAINRPVTLRAFAVAEGMDPSVSNMAAYTVSEPPVIEAPPEPEPILTAGSDQLESRRIYDAQAEGPSFQDIVLQDDATGLIVTANEGVIPRNAVLSVKLVQASPAEAGAVAQSQEGEIAALYEVALLVDGEEITPQGEIEVGLKIPSEERNALVSVCHLSSDVATVAYSTRRSAGMAYAVTDRTGRFALAVPDYLDSGASAGFFARYGGLLLAGGGGSAVLAAALLLAWSKKRKR